MKAAIRNHTRGMFLVLACCFQVGAVHAQAAKAAPRPGAAAKHDAPKPHDAPPPQPSAANATKPDAEPVAAAHGNHADQTHHDPAHDEGKPAGALERMIDKLGLADPARKKLQDLSYEADKRAKALKAEADRSKLELEHALEQDMPDANGVMKQMDKLAQLKAEFSKVWIKAELEASKLLSPEQREQLKRFSQGDFRRPTPQPLAAESQNTSAAR
jgi:Spy/CpxP family protein refolding chaperone